MNQFTLDQNITYHQMSSSGTEHLVPVAESCIAIGKSLGEAVLGQENQFAIVARDVFGNICKCLPNMFHVEVVPLTPALDEDR